MTADELLDARARRLDMVVERVVPYLGLVIGTVLTPAVVPLSPGFWLVTGPLVLVAALWSYVFVSRKPTLAENPRLGRVYIAGLLLLMAVLVHRSPAYAFIAYAGFVHSVAFLAGRWRWAGVLSTAVLGGYGQIGGGLVPLGLDRLGPLAGFTLVNVVLGGGFTYFGAFIASQSERRREVIAELNVANTRLSETLEENAGLHAQLLTQAREAGVLDERARMAREIHDTIAQGLTGIVTQLEAAGAADGDAELRGRHIDTARALARESLTEARRSVAALAPGQLVEARLPDAVADMAKKWAETAGVGLVVDTTGDPRPLLPDLEVTLFRVAQEALANVGKHARATRAGLTLSYMDDVVALDVRDDGVGFDPAAHTGPVGGSGFGLAAMEQRVRRVSGTLAVESTPAEGTAISVSVPAIPAETEQHGGEE